MLQCTRVKSVSYNHLFTLKGVLMKKLVYLSLVALMAAHTTTHCADILGADKEAGTDNPPKACSSELPSKQELAQQFLKSALVVSTMGRHGIASSEEFKKMQEVYQTHIVVNKGDKKQTKAELYGAADSFSEDEEYYEK